MTATFVKRVAPVDGRVAPAFLRERELLSRVAHPGVVRLVDARVEADATGVLVTERLDGPTLREVVANGPLASSRARALALELLDALASVHASGFVHGDLKPENVVVASRAVLVDFGLALAIGERWPDDGAGTPAYMAPEQVRKEQVDARTDLYALGATLYELVTGAPPFVGSDAQVRRRQLTSRPVPLAVVLDSVDEKLAEGIVAALAKAPDERPTSAGALAARLR